MRILAGRLIRESNALPRGKPFVFFLIPLFLSLSQTAMTLARTSSAENLITLFIAGDVMMGRGIDQVLPHPGDPRLHEPYLKDARSYVEIAEAANGPIQKPATCEYIWGDALTVLEKIAPDLRLINLETSITTSRDYWPDKGIHYKMHPENAACLNAFKIGYASLANNHVLDWGYAGLRDTLATLKNLRIQFAGAGEDLNSAAMPAILDLAEKGRVIVFSFGLASSGIPQSWAAREKRPGVNLLDDLSDSSVAEIKAQVDSIKKSRDITVASIHWGGNWGYMVPREHIEFAHRLIDSAGIDLVHGHSSHHPMPLEIYHGKPILYGSGDFFNDYEGIHGYEPYRSDLVSMYLAEIDAASGKLVRMRLIPLQIRRFRLKLASKRDALWLQETLNREGKRFGARLKYSEEDESMRVNGQFIPALRIF